MSVSNEGDETVEINKDASWKKPNKRNNGQETSPIRPGKNKNDSHESKVAARKRRGREKIKGEGEKEAENGCRDGQTKPVRGGRRSCATVFSASRPLPAL